MYTIYGLYETETPILKYIGITKQSPKNRKRGHLKAAFDTNRLDYNCPNLCWIRKVINSGNSVEMLIIKQVDSLEEASFLEKMLIELLGRKIFNKGLLMNTTEGGIENTNYNLPTGSANKKSRAVIQFSYNGDIINEYSSIKDAAFITGLLDSHISQCCKGKRHQHGRFIWRYKGDSFNKYPVNGNALRRISMFSKEGNFIKTFESAQDAAKEVGLKSAANLTSACKGNQITYGGYFWRYEGDKL